MEVDTDWHGVICFLSSLHRRRGLCTVSSSGRVCLVFACVGNMTI